MKKEITNDLLESKPTRAVQLPDGRWVTEKLAHQIDYEKKYNEALERARKAYNAIPPESRGARKIIEDAFPELRESEDEMIRRTLVEYFGPQAQLDFIRGVPIQKIRDWLEKQKDCILVPKSHLDPAGAAGGSKRKICLPEIPICENKRKQDH